MSEQSGFDLLYKWQDIAKVHHFEGSTRNLEKLVNVLGYRDQGFGDAVHEFLCDNPGAQQAIVEWIGEWIDRNSDWREAMEDEVLCPDCQGSVPPGKTCHECGEEGESDD